MTTYVNLKLCTYLGHRSYYMEKRTQTLHKKCNGMVTRTE